MKTLKVLKYVGFGILGLGFIILAVFVTMSLWNSLIPSLFNGPVLTFWQTAGLFILSKILLTGVAPGGHDRSKKDWRRKEWRKHYNDTCMNDSKPDNENVTPEQA
jgi:hypothetical protein